MKEPPKVRPPPRSQTKKRTAAAAPSLYVPQDSPLLDALLQGERVHQLMANNAGDYAIFMLDSEGYVASWNKGAEQVKGYSREEIVGKHFSVFYTLDDRVNGNPKRELEIAAREGRFEEEGKRVRKDGSEYWASVVLSAVKDRTDTLVGFVKVTRDLTDRLAAQERLLAVDQALEAVNADLEAFTYSVSHDLRAPIRQIEGFSKILEERLGKDLDPQVEHYLRRIQEGSKQMGRLVDDLLQLAQIGKQNAKPRRTSFDSIVGDVVGDMRAETTDRDIEWRVEPLPDVVCDPGLLKVVYTNLLSNAVKYSRPRDKTVIEIGQRMIEGRPVFHVRDNGVGFDMKYADKLFGVFQRLHRAEEFEGAGVGLATVQRIIRKHKGNVWAEATPGGGATFFFTLGTTVTSRPTTAA